MHDSDGIYDDGEWVSLDWINGQLYEQDVRAQYPKVGPQLAMLFDDLVESAHNCHAMTGRYLQIWGELSELYAEVQFGIQRHKPQTPGL